MYRIISSQENESDTFQVKHVLSRELYFLQFAIPKFPNS